MRSEKGFIFWDATDMFKCLKSHNVRPILSSFKLFHLQTCFKNPLKSEVDCINKTLWMVVKLKHAFTYETNICSIECCLQKLEFSAKYQAERINFLGVFMLLFLPPIPRDLLLYPRLGSMEEKLRNTNVLVDSHLFAQLIFIYYVM